MWGKGGEGERKTEGAREGMRESEGGGDRRREEV